MRSSSYRRGSDATAKATTMRKVMKRQHEANIARDLPAARQAELGDLEPLLARLAANVAPEPQPDETARLLDHLRPLVAARAATLPEWSQPRQALATRPALGPPRGAHPGAPLRATV